MKDFSNYESISRGTPDFQVELYDVNEKHPRYHMQQHWQNSYEIIYVVQGTLILRLNGKKVILSEGEGVFIPDGVIHGGTPSHCRYMCIVFSSSILYATQKSRLIMKTQIRLPIVLKNETLIKNIIKDMVEKSDGYQLSVIGNMYMLSHKLLTMCTDTKIKPNIKIEKVKPAMSYIEKNYASNITLAELAEECSMSPNYFCRFFKDITKETPIEYITRYRLEMACEFLLSGMTITDTAYSCGFNDTSYFINVFKKNIGITPQKYKHQKSQ